MPEALACVVCPVCQGESRALVNCRSCGGTGLYVQLPFGRMHWKPEVTKSLFLKRVWQRYWRRGVVILLGLLCLGLFASVILAITQTTSDVSDLVTSAFWLNLIETYGIRFWSFWLLLSFFIYRLTGLEERFAPMPNWGKTKEQWNEWLQHHKKTEERHDVSLHLEPAAWRVLELALGFSEQLGKADITPVQLFAAALVSDDGAVFLTRLGLTLDKTKQELAALLRDGRPGTDPVLTVETRRILLEAYVRVLEAGRRAIGVPDLLLGAFHADPRLVPMLDRLGFPQAQVEQVAEWIRLQTHIEDERNRFVRLAALKPNTAMDRLMTARQTPTLDQFAEDLTLLARNGYISPIFGREEEIEAVFQAFDGGSHGVVLVGDQGAGKMAIIEAIARKMVEEDVPPMLFDRRLVSVHLARLIAAGDTDGALERLLTLLMEVRLGGNAILVLQGIDVLAGIGNGSLDLSEAFASELERGGFSVIATCTPHAWTESMERRTLGSKLTRVNVEPPSVEQSVPMLMVRTGHMEYEQGVFFSYAALTTAAQFANRFIREIALPESALDLLQASAVLTRTTRGAGNFVSVEDVATVVHRKTGIPVQAVATDESKKLLNLETQLHKRVIGQAEAVTQVSQALRRARAELRDGKRPMGSFLFLGPTGVGKTELAKALADEYFGSAETMVRLDMSEYQDRRSIDRLIGAAGDTKGGLLTEAVRLKPFCLILLDELEKAHPDLLTLFLQVLDDGRLTDGIGRTVDFTHTIIIATSNAGSTFIQDSVKRGDTLDHIRTGLLEQELRGTFRPEFLNRFDGVIVFSPLSMDDVTRIAWLLINQIVKRLEEKGIVLQVDDLAVEALAKAGFDPLYGARPLRRVIQEKLENPLADALLRGELPRGTNVFVNPDGSLRVSR